ncbi:MAG: formate dehydrogenase accessory sulfurtransferase FdhD [Candidatus Bathyarchaeota archaeon]|nr:formate dehydrogenase accessory sulfurtransferase FdhD [Candidatus Bathyarchaeota archaeon]
MVNAKTEITITALNLAEDRLEKNAEIVAVESPLHLFLGSIHFISILCSPELVKELVVGHLLGEGLVSSVDEIASVDLEGNDVCRVELQKADAGDLVVTSRPYARLIVSACGSASYRSLPEILNTIKLKPLLDWKIKARIILECVRKLNNLAGIFKETGGVHVAALWNRNGELVMLAEDVGRHNAVDKVIGGAALSNHHLDECFLTLSGRMTGDIILKAARVGIPVVSSLAAAIDSGITVAKKAGITLVGFVRGSRMNVYSFPERIQL